MPIILTSTFPNDGNDPVFERLRAFHASPRIAWIPPQRDASGTYFPHAQRLFAKHGFTDLTPLDLDECASRRPLHDDFDFVYLTGGHPILFRDNAERAGLGRMLRPFVEGGGIVIGASGGAMLLTPSVALFAKFGGGTLNDAIVSEDALAGLALVGDEILPHANRFDGGVLGSLGEYARRVKREVIALDDGAAVIYAGAGNRESIGNVRVFTAGEPR